MPTENLATIIAEVGLSHEGSLGLAHAFIQSIHAAGADVAKFQIHIPDLESSDSEPFRVPFSTQDTTRKSYWTRTSFTKEQYQELQKHAQELGMGFCVSVFSAGAVEWARELNIEMIKVGSGDLINPEILEAFQGYKGSVILSTGMSTWGEIDSAVEKYLMKIDKEAKLSILQCTSMYPTPLWLTGVNVMKDMQTRYPACEVGISDHSPSIRSAVIAMSHGAKLVEKHVIFSREMFGPDVKASITFQELAELAAFRDEIPLILQTVDKDNLSLELSRERKIFGRSLGLKNNLPAGYLLELEDFCLRKPSGGLGWEDRHSLVGKVLVRDYNVGQLLSYDHLG